MAKKLVTMDAPADYVPEDAKNTNRTIIIDEVLSTGFNADNIDHALNPLDAGRILTDRVPFAKARSFAQLAAYRVGVIEGDLERHLQSLKDGVLIRTTEQQAALSIVDIDKAIEELRKARGVLSNAWGTPE